MPDDDVLASHIEQHRCGNLSRVGPGCLPVKVLAGQGDGRTAKGLAHRIERGKWRRHDDIHLFGAVQPGLQTLDEPLGLGNEHVHLPVSCHDRPSFHRFSPSLL